MPDRKYQFSWDFIGDINLGRPHLGPTMRIEVYRLMQGAFRDILEQRYGTEQTDEIFYESGKLAGKHFYKEVDCWCTGDRTCRFEANAIK